MNTRMFIIATALIAAFSVSHSAPLKEQRFSLSIENGSLMSVLEQLSQQTGLHVGAEISVFKSRVSDLGSFVGETTADDALRKLLAGTDLWYAWRDEDTIRLFLISAQPTRWRTDVSTAQEASDSLRELSGARYDTGACSELAVGPYRPEHPLSAEEFWVELIKPHCPVVRRPSANIEPGSIDRTTDNGQAEHTFLIPQMPRLRALQTISAQTGVDVGYLSSDAEEELALVGPIEGRLSVNEALKRAMQGTVLRVRWLDDDTVSVEPAYTLVSYADMSRCRCNFGLPEFRPVQSEHISVVKPRLPALEEGSPAPVAIFDRTFIDATGAATIPEVLAYLAQQAFSPSRGSQASGAQYFEGRGFGAQYSLVLINGHRAYGSAGDPMTNAVDLNVVPLSAVERVEVAIDQPSVLHGTDGFGGTVNIVLKRELDGGAAQTSLGSAQGGAQKTLFTLSADGTWANTTAGFVFEHLARGALLGAKRDRWRNQDYSRYPGGLDYRLPFGAPPNVRSLTGDFGDINASEGTFRIEPDGAVFRAGETNLQSALSDAAIEPDQTRSSLYAFTSTALDSAQLKLAALVGQHSASLQLFPVSASGLIWGAQHPQNPFDDDVLIDTLLTGLPPHKQEAESTLTRVSAELSGSVRGWAYSAFLITHQERSRTWFANEIDPSVLAHSLTTDDPAAALNVLSARPGEGHLPAGLLLPAHKNLYLMRATQAGVTLSGTLLPVRGGDIIAEAGLSHRHESVHFDEDAMSLAGARDVSSVYARVQIPILSAASASLLRDFNLAIGARRDFHSDVRDITTKQAGLSWQPFSGVKVHAGYSELFRPPSLYELYLPRFLLPFELLDPQRNEVAPIMLITGGNPFLHPTEGQSIDLGMTFHADNDFKASINYWETQMRDRIWLVLAQDLLNVSSPALASRTLRAERTEADIAANRPGRLLALDTTRDNFGAVNARGIDFSIQRAINTGRARLTPRLEITRTLDFRYRELPAVAAPMSHRAGVASNYGTVPSGRAVLSVQWEMGGWRASAFARHHSSYRDYSSVERPPTYRIPAQTILDLKLSKEINDHLSISAGAINALDDQAPFAPSGGWEGYDPSQGSLVGREVTLSITGSF